MTTEQFKKELFRTSSMPQNSDNEAWMGEIVDNVMEFAQRWIPVSERLPEIKDESYQIIVKTIPTPSGTVLCKVIAVFRFLRPEDLEEKFKNYTHWKPIDL